MSAPEAELRALMSAGLNGDAEAHRALLDHLSHHLRIYYKNRLLRSGRTADDAEDLVQETLTAVHFRRHTYDPDELFTPWMHAIARYKLIDHLRRTRAVATALPIDDAHDLTAKDDHAHVESALDLNRLLQRLPEKIRRAIRLMKIEGLSVAETARQCGMSEAAVKVSVHRGMRAMEAAAAEGQDG